MTQIAQVSRAELARAYTATYQGRRARACLAVNPGSLTVNSTVAQWDAAEISGNGYARFEWTIGAGAFDATLDAHKGAVQAVTFTPSAGGLGLQFDTLYVVTGTLSGGTPTWDAHVALLLPLSPSVALPAGSPGIVYNLPFIADDITSLPGVT